MAVSAGPSGEGESSGGMGAGKNNAQPGNSRAAMGEIWGGVKALLVSQLSSRLLTFLLNMVIVRLLTPEEYGMAAVQFHLMNTTILLLSREGFRRGCLVGAGTGSSRSLPERDMMPVAALVVPIGVVVSLGVTLLALALTDSSSPQRFLLMSIQGAAALAELAGEPLYIVAQGRLLFRLRVATEAAAQVTKAAVTIGLLAALGGSSAAMALSAAQLSYGCVLTLGYTWAFRGELRQLLSASLHSRSSSSGRRVEGAGGEEKVKGAEDEDEEDEEPRRRLLRLCGAFSMQAVEKLVLAEGSKMVMAALETSYSQGVYGMVSNLGSLVVRLLFQPLEEGAFTAFVAGAEGLRAAQRRRRAAAAASPPPGGSSTEDLEEEEKLEAGRLAALVHGLLKAAVLVGGIMAAFGPAYSYTALRLVYGRRWADSGTAPALGMYASYVALLAVNGISEAFTHAAGDEAQLKMANAALIVFGAVHMATSFVFCKLGGTPGLITADAIGMVLRICYSLVFMRGFFRGYPNVKASAWVPHPAALGGLGACAAAGALSERLLLSGHLNQGYLQCAAAHVAIGVALLVALAGVIYRTEGRQLRDAIRWQVGKGGKSD